MGQPLDDADTDFTVAFEGASASDKPSGQVPSENKPSAEKPATDGSSLGSSSFGKLDGAIAAILERVKKFGSFFSNLVLPGLNLAKYV